MTLARPPRPLALLLSAAALTAHAAPMQPGLWELTMTITSNGNAKPLPAERACISQKDIDDGTRTLPRPDGACSLSNVRRTADAATYDLACTQNDMTTTGRAEIAFAGERYDGKVDMKVTGRGSGSIPVALTLAATRVGDCAK